MTEPLKVDIWSDIACPFCYMGKRKFEAGVAASGVPVEIEYHSFELGPDAPENVSGSHAAQIAQKMGISVAEAEQIEVRVAETARSVGLAIDYNRMQPANTSKAHQVLHFAKAHDRQIEMKERLMSAYFSEGRHVGQVDELADLAVDVGLDRQAVIDALGSGQYLDDVAADIQQAARYGIRGVPFFVIEQKYVISGAQDSEVFAGALEAAQQEKAAAS